MFLRTFPLLTRGVFVGIPLGQIIEVDGISTRPISFGQCRVRSRMVVRPPVTFPLLPPRTSQRWVNTTRLWFSRTLLSRAPRKRAALVVSRRSTYRLWLNIRLPMHWAQSAKQPPSLLVEMVASSGCRARAAPLSLSHVWLGAVTLSMNSLTKNSLKVISIGHWNREGAPPARPLT